MFILTRCSLLLFNMFMSGVIVQVRGRDGMSTLQNGAAPYSLAYHYLPGCLPYDFRLSVL